jgi:uncharacterized protein YdaT
MPWRSDYYPAAMKHLSAPVREKAIAIANALLEQGYDEGKAIRVGIARAKAWAATHPRDADRWAFALPDPDAER